MNLLTSGEEIQSIQGWGMGPLPGLMKTVMSEEEHQGNPECTLTPLEGDKLCYIWANENPNVWKIVYFLRRSNGNHKALLRIKESGDFDRIYVLSPDDGKDMPQRAQMIIRDILARS